MKDIEEALQEIIFKYDLDRFYPHYRNMYKAELSIRNIVTEMIGQHEKALFVGDDETAIEFVRNIAGDYKDIQFLTYDRSNCGFPELSVIDWQECGKIYLIAFYGAEYVEQWFRTHDIQYEWIYDIFEREGIFLQREFYIFSKEDLQPLIHMESHAPYGKTESIQCELYCQREKYKTAENDQTKQIALEKCLFLSIYIRNFLEAGKYIDLLSKRDSRFESLWEEIQNLLDTLKRSVKKRMQRDIMLYWMDAISYGHESNMPYLQSIMRESIVFENAFTYIYWTKPTLRAMFLGKKDIDDLVYNISDITYDNSPVLKFLEEHDYELKVFSGYYANNFPAQCRSKRLYIDMFQPFSMCLWDMLTEMLAQKRKTVWIVHAFAPHFPYISGKITDDNYNNETELYKLARQEIDEQLAFYDSYICDNAFRIYMSDHGGHRDISRFHILFNVYHSLWHHAKVEGMFSLLDFGRVLAQIILQGNIKEEELVKDYVPIGGLDWYSRRVVERVLKNKELLTCEAFGCKGIIDREYIYLKYKTGKEWLQKRKDMLLLSPMLFYEGSGDVCEPALLSKYRELTGGWPEGIDLDEKFKYSKYLYILYHNVLKHSDMPERVKIINGMFEGYEAGSIGIRLGGYHSAALYYILSEENRKKVWGFIDNDVACLCSRLRLPIVNSDWIQGENIEKAGIKAILLSSYTNLEKIRRESKTYPDRVAVLDIYDCLNKNGIWCRDNFWVINGTDRDYDVGFLNQ